MGKLQDKVHKLYDLIGDRGLFVNTNHDVFVGPAQEVRAGISSQYAFRLLNDGGRAYSSPMLFAALTSLLNHGTMLFTGAPGIGKTTGAYLAGHFFTGQPYDEILQATVHGHPQQTEEKMIGRYHTGKLLQGEEVVRWRNFVTSKVKIANEFNRLGPDLLNVLMDFIDTGKATYGEEVTTAAPGPLFATMNYADGGTYDVPPPMMDRFDVAVVSTSPQPWDLEAIAARSDEKLNGGLQKLLVIPEGLILSDDERAAVRSEVSQLPVSSTLGTYVNFILATIRYSESASDSVERMTKGNAWREQQMDGLHFVDHPSLYTRNELSVRAVQSLRRYSRALAWLTGSSEVTEEHVRTVFPYAVWHRLQPTEKAFGEWPKTINDRVSFSRNVLNAIDAEWTTIQSEPVLKTYDTALRHLQGEGGKTLDAAQRLTVAKNTIERVCAWDNPYAQVLAKHVESVYNRGRA